MYFFSWNTLPVKKRFAIVTENTSAALARTAASSMLKRLKIFFNNLNIIKSWILRLRATHYAQDDTFH